MHTNFEWISAGGVTSAQGYRASGVAAGLKAGRTDLAILLSDRETSSTALFTQNNIPAAPVQLDRELIKGGHCRAAVINVGCANACTGKAGLADAVKMGEAAAAAVNIPTEQMLVCSTGTIGRRLKLDRILDALPAAAAALSEDGGDAAAHAIMTTDTVAKQAAATFEYDGKKITIGGMCKGAGMICPNLATTLIFITTDACISPENLKLALTDAVSHSFNRVTVDGDQSTNDTCVLFANGAAGAAELTPASGAAWECFMETLRAVALSLAKQIVMDGEGATKFVTVTVEKAATPADAYAACEEIANSPLFKTACFGGDPNWGRVISAVGNSGAKCAELETQIYFDHVCVFDKGNIADEAVNAELAQVMKQRAFTVRVVLNMGEASDEIYTSDFSYEYVKINGEYTT